MLNSSEVNNWIGILTVNFENTLENWTGSTENVPIGSDLLLIISDKSYITTSANSLDN